MKRRNIVTLILLLLASIGINITNFLVTPDLYTRIINTEITPLFELAESSFIVSIPFEIEIWNPNPFPIIVHTANRNLLTPGVTIHFNEPLLTYLTEHIVLPMTNTHFVKPGITQINYTISFSVYRTYNIFIPYGRYEFCVRIRPSLDRVFIFLKMYGVVDVFGYDYNSDEHPHDWGHTRIFSSNWGFFTISIAIITISLTLYYNNKRIFNKNL